MHVRPITRSDLFAVTNIAFDAFKEDEFFGWLNPGRDKYPGDMRRNQSIRLRERLVTPGQHGYVAVTDQEDPDWDGEEKVVGFAFYIRSAGDEAAEKWRADTLFNSMSISSTINLYVRSQILQSLNASSCSGSYGTTPSSSIEPKIPNVWLDISEQVLGRTLHLLIHAGIWDCYACHRATSVGGLEAYY